MHSDKTACHFLVLAPLDLEISAIVELQRDRGGSITKLDQTFYPTLYEIVPAGGRSELNQKIVLIRLNRQGVLNAAVDTCLALQMYEPTFVVSFGIAGSLDPEDAPIGSAIFATALFYYEPSKDQKDAAGKSTVISRMDPVAVDTTLLNIFRQFESSQSPVVDGPFASGEKLMADVNSVDRGRILSANSKVLALDMEAAGVGRAVEVHAPHSRFLVVKGISDLADPAKNTANQDERRENRRIAATNAGAALSEVFRLAPVSQPWTKSIQWRWPRSVGALSEAIETKEILSKHGLEVSHEKLHRVLENRPGRIPVYFHWRQYHEHLHWIDFRILCAIADLPPDVFEPIALVTLCCTDSQQDWRAVVERTVGTLPVTDIEVNVDLDMLADIARGLGLTPRIEEEVRSKLQEIQRTGAPSTTLAWLRYMISRAPHRRMVIFTWKEYSRKWEALDWLGSVSYVPVYWETYSISGVSKKTDAPNSEILIDSELSKLSNWFARQNDDKAVNDLLAHFEHLSPSGKWGDSVLAGDFDSAQRALLGMIRDRMAKRKT